MGFFAHPNEDQWILCRINTKRFTNRAIESNWKINDRENPEKAREKSLISKKAPIQLTADFSFVTMEGTQQWKDICWVLGEVGVANQEIYIQQNHSSKIKVK